MSEMIQKEKPETNLYEVGYLLSPMVPEEDAVAKADEGVRMAIEQAPAVVTSAVHPKRRPLAYAVGKSVNHKRTSFREAYFGSFRFEAMSDALVNLKKSLDESDLVIRFIIVSVPRRAELPIVPRRAPVRRAATQSSDKVATPEKAQISEEEIDKEIEGLLAPAA